jgi:hypothetical protein
MVQSLVHKMNFDKGEAVNAGQIFCGDCAHGLIFTQRREVRKELFIPSAYLTESSALIDHSGFQYVSFDSIVCLICVHTKNYTARTASMNAFTFA